MNVHKAFLRLLYQVKVLFKNNFLFISHNFFFVQVILLHESYYLYKNVMNFIYMYVYDYKDGNKGEEKEEKEEGEKEKQKDEHFDGVIDEVSMLFSIFYSFLLFLIDYFLCKSTLLPEPTFWGPTSFSAPIHKAFEKKIYD